MVDFFNAKHLFCYALWFILAYFNQRYKILERHQCWDRKWYLPWCFIITYIILAFHWYSFFTSETCIDSLRYIMMSLSSTKFCYQVFIVNNPTFVFSFQYRSCQILLHSATSTGFSTPGRVQAESDIRVLMFWAGDIEGLLCSRHFLSSTFSSSIFLWQIYDFSIISGFCSCKCQRLLISCCKIWINLPAHPSFWKIFTCFCQEIDKVYQVKLSSPTCCGSFCFPLMTPTALYPFVGQEILSAGLYFCLCVMELLCEFQQITLTCALSDLLRWQDFEARTASYSLFLWCQSKFHNSNKSK